MCHAHLMMSLPSWLTGIMAGSAVWTSCHHEYSQDTDTTEQKPTLTLQPNKQQDCASQIAKVLQLSPVM